MTMGQPHEEMISSRPRLDEMPTRRRSGIWDRIKILLLLVGLLGFFVAAEIADNPILPVSEAINETLRSKVWLLVLIGLELLRQLHYLVSEHSAPYHQFWTKRVFGGWNRYLTRFNPWNRYRFARAVKWVVAIVVGAIILGRILDTSPFTAYFDGLSEAIDAAPVIVQAAIFLLFWIGFQFLLMFYFMTCGGVETFFPDDITTRFSDVWGQDQVKHKVRENLLFLDNPEVIEQKGGYVPSGILLWGPPGTGKTLMAEAMAGETGMPFVNVDASMLGIGIGPLKVILLFRKLRKYALKYGGVVVFFDEADSLGNRGLLAGQPGQGLPAKTRRPSRTRASAAGSATCPTRRATTLLSTPLESDVEEGARRNRFIMGMGGMGGGGGGILQVLLAQLSGLEEAARLLQPARPARPRHQAEAATEVPHARRHGDEPPGEARRRAAPPRAHRPDLQGRLPVEGRAHPHLRGVPRQDRAPAHARRTSTGSATVTPYATGATIKDLVNEALIGAIRDGRDIVSWGDIVKAKQLKDLGPPEDVEYIERERHATALHEACHAVVAYRVRHHLVIDIATIEKGGNYLGMVSSIPPEDLFTRWRSDYESDVMVSLASLAGEKMFFGGDSSSGVSGDLETATSARDLHGGLLGDGSDHLLARCHPPRGSRWGRPAGQARRREGARPVEGRSRRADRGEAAGSVRAHRGARARQPRAGPRGHARARDEQDADR